MTASAITALSAFGTGGGRAAGSRAAGRAAAAKPRDPSPAADHDARPRAGGAVEVTCGWGVVSLAELRASSTVTVPLKGGAPWGETEFGADGAAPSSLWRTLTGSAGAPRLTLRVAGGAAAEAAPRGCLVPVPLAPLLNAYHAYLDAYLRRHVAASSTHVADPVLAVFRRILSLDAGRRAALYDEICALGAQAWMTGTGPELFSELGARAQHIHVTDTDGISQISQAT